MTSVARLEAVEASVPQPPNGAGNALKQMLDEGVTWGDAADWLPALPPKSVDLFFTSPPYADARAYSRIHPDRYVDWFLEFARPMLTATRETGWFVLNIKNRVAKAGPCAGSDTRTCISSFWRCRTLVGGGLRPTSGRNPTRCRDGSGLGPRTHSSTSMPFRKGPRPYFNLDAIRVPYKTAPEEIERRKLDENGRRNTEAGFGRDRTKTYARGGADPGNVVTVSQTYNQHYGPSGQHTAVMPEGLASFFVQAACPPGGIVIDPFAGSATTSIVARRSGRRAGGLELAREYVNVAHQRIADDFVEDDLGLLTSQLA